MRKMFFLAFLLFAVPLFAQDEAVRFYLVPTVTSGVYNSPKYFGGRATAPLTELVGATWSGMMFGIEKVYLIGSVLTSNQHQALTANVDVLALPTNLDGQVSALALNAVQNGLENLKIPGTWVSTDTTYRQVLHVVASACLLNQELEGLVGKSFFDSGITLDSRVNQIATATRQAINQGAQQMGLDTSGITGTTKVRDVILILAAQMPTINVLGEII